MRKTTHSARNALVGYALLSIVMTWPAIRNLTTAIPGDGFDGWQNYWNQWWIKEALLNRHTLFFFTDILYPPTGVSLIFHTLNYFNGLWTLPLQLNFGPTVAYNAVVFFHFVFSGFGVYLLARYTLSQLKITGPRGEWAAFTAGLIFTFSPFHMAHLLGHMQVLSLTWPPFYILWLLKTLNGWRIQLANDPTASLNKKDLALSGLFLALVTTIDWYQTLYMLLFTALALAWTLWRAWRDAPATWQTLLKPVLGLAAMGLAFGLIFAPLLIPMVAEAATADYMRPDFSETVVLSADLLAFFTPSELHPWWGKSVAAIYQTFTTTTSERLIFAGFIPLGLGLVAGWYYAKTRLGQFWLLFTGAFFTLALGPYLHILGRIVTIGKTPLPLPYLFLYKLVPFIGISRSLSRFALMVMIGLGVLAAMGLARFRPKIQWLLTGLILIEFLVIPFPMSPVDTPAFFNTLAAEPDDYTIACLPMNWDRPAPLLYQTVHKKALLTAYTSRNNPLDQSRRTPVFQQWRALDDDIINTDLAAVAPTIFTDFNLKYVVLDYYQMPPGPEREQTEYWVAQVFGDTPPAFQDNRLTVYRAPHTDTPRPYLQLGAGWGKLTHPAGQPARAMQQADLRLRHAGDAPLQLTIETAAPLSPASLAVSVDGRPLQPAFSANESGARFTLPAQTETIRLTAALPLTITGLLLTGP